MENQNKKKISAVNLVLIIQLIVMAILITFMTVVITKISADDAINHMETITDERAQIIQNYVENAEKTLTAYSRAGEIYQVLMSPTDAQAVSQAQHFTESFSKDIENLEGIYVSEWNTHCLAHTNPQTVGITTREGDPLLQLQNAMLEKGDGVYDTGIIISPASGEQIVSMYKAVYDTSGKPIGLVGLGIYTEGLIDTLDNMSIHGIENTFYSMVNTADKKYIFHTDKSKVTTVAENQQILELCQQYTGSSVNETGEFTYKADENFISSYSYISKYGWILMLDAPSKEVYAVERQLRIFMLIFAVLMIGLVLIFSYLNKKQEIANQKLYKQVERTEKTKESLNTAIFNDILTNVRNRTAFTMDLDKGRPDIEHTCYFAMINIADFSEVNTRYGTDTGDAVLVATAEKIQEAFPDGAVYRTGSDEFVIALQTLNDVEAYQQFTLRVQEFYNTLLQPQETPIGLLQISYRLTVVKKSKELNASLITAMKDLMNHAQNALSGQMQYTDLDKLL